MSKRNNRRRQQQDALLNCASAILAEHGPDAVTMAALAQRMDASVGGLYRYYPSKAAIFVALQLKALERLDATLKEALALEISNNGHSWAVVTTVFDAWSTFEKRHPTLAKMLNQFAWRTEAVLPAEEQETVAARVTEIILRITDILKELTEKKVMKPGDPALRAYCLWGTVAGFGQLRQRRANGMSEMPIDKIRLAYLEDLKSSWRMPP